MNRIIHEEGFGVNAMSAFAALQDKFPDSHQIEIIESDSGNVLDIRVVVGNPNKCEDVNGRMSKALRAISTNKVIMEVSA